VPSRRSAGRQGCDTLPHVPSSRLLLRVVPAAALVALVLGGAAACRITPQEVQRIETENELLREQIRVMRTECEQYKQLELHIDESEPKSPTPEAR
jgi:hypothetical protein